MRIIVVNLPNRSDRRSEMQSELTRIGWQAEFFPAIKPAAPAGFPSIGARGCFLSHLAVLKTAYEQNFERLVILEDDVNFALDFSTRWPTAVEALESQSWSIFYPGHALESLPTGVLPIAPHIGVRCTHFMMIKRTAFPLLIQGLETILSRPPGHPLGGPMHVDGAYSTLRAQNSALTTFICSPPLGYQRPSRTDIGDLKWFDRMRVVRHLAGYLRRSKNVIKRTLEERT